jgi:signal transduction histidine kinase
VEAAYRVQVLVNETRTEVKGSLVALIGLAFVTGFLVVEYRHMAPAAGLRAWVAAMGGLLTSWLAAWIGFVLRPPSDAQILRWWIPGAKAGMAVCNVVIAASVWLFMPPAGPELRALMIILYAWYLVIQFVAATEATQVLVGAVVLVLGSLVAWLLVAMPPYALPLAFFLALFGGTLLAVRRFVRAAVVEATAARAAVARERDAKTHFIRAASHDLQQPLQAAALFLNQVKPGGKAAEQALAFGALRQSLTAARALVAAMLEHLKLEGGVIRPSLQAIRAGDVFDRMLLTQRPNAAAASIRIRLAGDGHWIIADPALLTRAIENLVANAVRHSGAGKILIGARRRGDAIELWVADNGQGIAADDRERIFSPFEQGGRVGAEGGFGLGLASTRNLVALMDGQCGLAPARVRGAAFFIRLPAAAAIGEEGLPCAA